MYLKAIFPEAVFTFVGIVLLAAAMSTLDGLLVSISTITANDLVLNVMSPRRLRALTEEQRMAFALRVSHVVLVLIAIAAFLINLQPPRLLGIFGQTGVYGLTAASAVPLLLGVMFRRLPLALVWTGSALALAIHFLLFFDGSEIFPGSTLTFGNPGVTASLATLVTLPPLLLAGAWLNRQGAAALTNSAHASSDQKL
jgi:sodium/pantothenate symporter